MVYLCVICNSNRFHSFIFKLCIMIVHTLKLCTGDAGPEQSLVLFDIVIEVSKMADNAGHGKQEIVHSPSFARYARFINTQHWVIDP